jgi:Ser/Thr protein kinase RdoA (MazF antagonist)
MILDARGTLGTATPYADLTPASVLDALDAVGMRGDGRLIQLNSYENRVFQAFLEDGQVAVLKFYRPGRWSDEQILEEHAFAIELAQHEIPVVAPIALVATPNMQARVSVLGEHATLAVMDAQAGTHRFAVTPRRAGRAPEFDDPRTLQWIGRFLGRMHAVGAAKAFRDRSAFNIANVGFAARDWLRDHDTIAADAQRPWDTACDAALLEVQRLFDAAGDIRQLRLHGDCHAGNLLWTDAGPHFVDLDDACTGPAVQDLWMLLSGDEHAMNAQLGQLLSGYEQFMDFEPRERLLIEPLRTLRMIHHSAWIARRWSDPAFPVAFPWFEGSAYWHQQAQHLREQADAMRRL